MEVPFISVYAGRERRVHLVRRHALAQRPNVIRWHFTSCLCFWVFPNVFVSIVVFVWVKNDLSFTINFTLISLI
jgi:hypothetical protein